MRDLKSSSAKRKFLDNCYQRELGPELYQWISCNRIIEVFNHFKKRIDEENSLQKFSGKKYWELITGAHNLSEYEKLKTPNLLLHCIENSRFMMADALLKVLVYANKLLPDITDQELNSFRAQVLLFLVHLQNADYLNGYYQYLRREGSLKNIINFNNNLLSSEALFVGLEMMQMSFCLSGSKKAEAFLQIVQLIENDVNEDSRNILYELADQICQQLCSALSKFSLKKEELDHYVDLFSYFVKLFFKTKEDFFNHFSNRKDIWIFEKDKTIREICGTEIISIYVKKIYDDLEIVEAIVEPEEREEKKSELRPEALSTSAFSPLTPQLDLIPEFTPNYSMMELPLMLQLPTPLLLPQFLWGAFPFFMQLPNHSVPPTPYLTLPLNQSRALEESTKLKRKLEAEAEKIEDVAADMDEKVTPSFKKAKY